MFRSTCRNGVKTHVDFVLHPTGGAVSDKIIFNGIPRKIGIGSHPHFFQNT